jgi:hypothetical protein
MIKDHKDFIPLEQSLPHQSAFQSETRRCRIYSFFRNRNRYAQNQDREEICVKLRMQVSMQPRVDIRTKLTGLGHSIS